LNKLLNRRIIAILTFTISLILLSTGLLLKKGIAFNNFNIATVTVSDFSLQWRNKLEIEIGSVTVKKQPNSGSFKNFNLIKKGTRTIIFLSNFFSKVSVKSINLGDITGAIRLVSSTGEELSFLNLSSSSLEFKSNLTLQQNNLIIDIKKFSSNHFRSSAIGQIHLNNEKEYITGTLLVNVADILPIRLDFTADQKQISFTGKEAGEINNITAFVDLFNLDKNIQRWITGYLKGSHYNLKDFKGVIPWAKPGSILDTLYAEVRVDNLEYTFAPGNPGLEPIKASYADITFSKGVLIITPHESTFCGQKIRNGQVEIDFTRPTDIILTAHIQTRARANEDILTLLNYYNIVLPLKQQTGNTETDFFLTINLNKGQIKTRGTFLIDKSVILFDGKKYDVTDTRIVLKNNKFDVQGAVSFEKLFVAGLSGTFETQSGTGDLNIILKRASFNIGKSKISLDESGPSPVINYHIRPKSHSLTAGASSWNLDSIKFHLNSFTAPLNINTLSISLPSTLVTILPGISAKISGSLNLKEKKIDMYCNLLEYQINNLVLEKSDLPISIHYDNEWTIKTEKISRWKINNISMTLYPSRFKYSGSTISMIDGRINYSDFFDSRISGHYNYLAEV